MESERFTPAEYAAEQKQSGKPDLERERTLLGMFRGKAGKVARVLALTSVMAGGGVIGYELGEKLHHSLDSESEVETLTKKEPLTIDQWMELAEERPFELLWRSDNLNDAHAKPIVSAAAEKEPLGALLYAEKFIQQPWAGEVVRRAAERHPEAALMFKDNYKDKLPDGQEIFKSALETLKASSDPSIRSFVATYETESRSVQ